MIQGSVVDSPGERGDDYRGRKRGNLFRGNVWLFKGEDRSDWMATMTHQPSDKVGLYPVRLVIGELDDLGNPQATVSFDLHADDGSLLRGFQFLSLDVAGVLTSINDQRLDAQRIGPQGASALLTSPDAVLTTVSDPDAPATIGLSSQRVRLFLSGFQFGEWQVGFETGVDPFRLDGRWR